MLIAYSFQKIFMTKHICFIDDDIGYESFCETVHCTVMDFQGIVSLIYLMEQNLKKVNVFYILIIKINIYLV